MQYYHIRRIFKKVQEKVDKRRKTKVQAINDQYNNQKKSNLNNIAQPTCFLLILQKKY